MKRWKIGHRSHSYNKGEDLQTIYKQSISCYVVELFGVFEGDRDFCLLDEFYHLCIH